MRIVTMLLLGAVTVYPAGREVTLTLDDLPRGGDGGPPVGEDERIKTTPEPDPPDWVHKVYTAASQ